MEHDRFGDVEFRILEGPDEPPRRPPRRRRWALAILASLFVAGGVTAGASALTGSGDDASSQSTPTKPRQHLYRNAAGVPVLRSGPECHAGKAHRRAHTRSAAPQY
jgi:hypothetical protein